MEILQSQYQIHENVIFGINAAGKGTQYRKLGEYFSACPEIYFTQKSIGDYCRGVKKTPELFPQYREHIEPHLADMAAGLNLPDPNIITVAELALIEEVGRMQNSGGTQRLVVGWDGFPRSEPQLDAYLGWEEQLLKKGVGTKRSFMYLELSDSEVIKRTWNRVVQEMLGAGIIAGQVDHLSESRFRQMVLDAFPIAVATPGVNVRDDDHPVVVPQRIETFKIDTLPTINKVAKAGLLNVIDGDQEIDIVHNEILRFITPQLKSSGIATR